MRIVTISVLLIVCIAYSVSAADTITKDALEKQKILYELQERCNKDCEHWANRVSYGMDYIAHYNSHLNKCFALSTLHEDRIEEGKFSNVLTVLYEVNENIQYGHLTTRFYDNSDMATYYQCTINQGKAEEKGYQGDEAKEKWAIFVKEMMED